MKKMWVLIIIFILLPTFLYASSDAGSDDYYLEFGTIFYPYSRSWEFGNGINNDYHSLGMEYLYSSPSNFFKNSHGGVHVFGFKYKWGHDDKIISTSYIIGDAFYGTSNGFYAFGLGTNISLNASTGTFGFSPEIDLMYISWIKATLSYRYNIYIGKKNSHEITLSIGLFSIFLFLKESFSL